MGNTKETDPILLEKYLAIKRSRKTRRKRVPANTWIKTIKLPASVKKRPDPPKIDDSDELDSALSSLGVIHCSSSDFGDFKVPSNQFAETSIEDDTSLFMGQTNFDLSASQPQSTDPQLIDHQKELDALNNYFGDSGEYQYIAINPQDLGDIQFDQFIVEQPQESILSTTSPFPSSMSSPSIPSTSPEQQLPQSDESKVPDIHSSYPPQTLIPSQCPLPPSPACASSSSHQPPPPPPSSQNASLPPPQPSYGKDIFQLLNNRTNQSDSSDSDSDSGSDSESDD